MLCFSQTSAIPWSGRVSMSENWRRCVKLARTSNAREDSRAHLNLIGHDGSRAELCADLVGPDRIEIDNAQGCDEAFSLQVLQISQGGHITLIRVVLPIELQSSIRKTTVAKSSASARDRPAGSRGGWCACVSYARGQRPRLWSERVRRRV
jgi:hypothetical protein